VPPVGLLPAGGRALRLSRLPCSKEILPLGAPQGGDGRVRVACDRLLEGMRAAGAERAYVVVGDGKLDIPAYLGDGSIAGLDLAYLTVERSPSTITTIDRAYAFVRDELVVFGFPDIVFEPVDALARLVERQAETGAAVVLGLFPAARPEQVDMVDADDAGRVRQIVIKPAETTLRLAWILAVWTPELTRFLHERRAAVEEGSGGREPYVGDVVQSAIDAGLAVDSVAFPEGSFVDVGTPDGLRAAAAGDRYSPRPTAT
jgi:glucose-1-phosphate thymidylyltransferase